jgi:hypothetical protein
MKDPIEYFPYEIFTKIIRFASYGVSGGPLTFLMTSTRWMITILDTPEAWTCIRIDNSSNVYHYTVASLELSRGRPIDLHLSWALCSTEALNIAMKESSRIRAIIVNNIDHQVDRPILNAKMWDEP